MCDATSTSTAPQHITSEVHTGTCYKCRGTGYLPHYAHYAKGVCFQCDGVGVMTVLYAVDTTPVEPVDFTLQMLLLTNADMEDVANPNTGIRRDTPCLSKLPLEVFKRAAAVERKYGVRHVFSAEMESAIVNWLFTGDAENNDGVEWHREWVDSACGR
jgi:hypothetical protein